MDSAEITEISDLQQTSEFLTARDLVALRKLPEVQPHLTVGQKFSTVSNSSLEEEAVKGALEDYKEILLQKHGGRICDLMHAEWNEEFNAAVTSNLKGKFVQHMGYKRDGQICLSPNESLFLLENGCIEIINGKTPMSTEEAYATMLKGHLSGEKYKVYSYLSQLGFIVIPHRKELNIEKRKNVSLGSIKRKITSSLPEEPCSKRLTFSGALSEECNINTNNHKSDNNELDNFSAPVIGEESNVIQCSNEAEHNKQLDENELQINIKPSSENVPNTVVEPALESANVLEPAHLALESADMHDTVVESCASDALESAKENAVLQNSSNQNSSQVLEPQSSTHIEEMDIDSSTEISLIASEKSREVLETDVGITQHSQDSQCSILNIDGELNNDDNSEILTCSSDNSLGDVSQGNFSTSLYGDDEVTLLEVTKKETTPLAVIDLLSGDESSSEDAPEAGRSDNDGNILVEEIKVSNVSNNKKKVEDAKPVKLDENKSRKFYDCKVEEAGNQSAQASSFTVEFPDMFRRDLSCVAAPPLNFLPNHVKPCKEAYILDFAKLRANQCEEPQPRLWNSFRDLQDYQRSRRLNQHSDRPFPRFHNRESNSRNNQYSRHRVVLSSSTQDLNCNNRRSDHRQDFDRIDRSSSGEGRGDVDYRNNNSTDQQGDIDYRNGASTEDQKPPRPTNSPVMFANANDQTNFPNGSLNTHQIPQFQNSSPANSMTSAGRPGLNVGIPVLSRGLLNIPSPNLPAVPHMATSDIAAEVHRTAYSYATSILSSMFGPNFNPNNYPPFHSFPPDRNNHQFRMNVPNRFNSNFFNAPFDRFQPNNRRNFRYHYRNRRIHRGNPFPSPYQNATSKRSWNEVRSSERATKSPSDEESEIEEIPISPKEFLWSASNLCPLVKCGPYSSLSEVLKPVKRSHMAKMIGKSTCSEMISFESTSIEITFDVYLPGSNYKKSCPGIPKYRIIILRSVDPIPRDPEIEFLRNKWKDGSLIQIAVVDNNDISFCSFNNVTLPDLIPCDE